MDTDVIDYLAGTHHTIVTLEENVLRGGYGERVTDYVQKHYPQIKVVNIALPDAYVEHGNVSVLRNELGIDSDSILAQRNEKVCWRLTRKHDGKQKSGSSGRKNIE